MSRLSLSRLSLLHAASLTLLVSLGCRQTRDQSSDPRLDFFYSVAAAKKTDATTLEALPIVEVASDGAMLGAVVRDLALQAGISLIYPQDWETTPYTGNLRGSADVVLDSLSRLHDVRFTVQGGVGFIGKPLPDDRTIGVVQTTLSEPERVLQPLMSETGKITSSGGWIFLSDRAEIVMRVLSAMKKVIPRTYCVQLLETLVDQNQFAGLTVQLSPTITAYRTLSLYDRIVDASLSDSGAFLGRSWLGVVGEGREYKQFSGQTESREKVILTADNQVIKDSTAIQTGFRLNYHIASGILTASISQDSSEDLNYAIETELPRPGLYLVHASVVKAETRTFGVPASSYRFRDLRRYIWIRYAEMGSLSYGAPVPAIYDPQNSVRK